MSISKAKSKTAEVAAESVTFDNENMYVHLTDGRTISTPFARFRRLRDATPQQREAWEIFARGKGIHWEEIDEDISVPNLLLDPSELLTYR